MAKYYYVVVNYRNNPILINSQLPIYYSKKVALNKAAILKASVIRIDDDTITNAIINTGKTIHAQVTIKSNQF